MEDKTVKKSQNKENKTGPDSIFDSSYGVIEDHRGQKISHHEHVSHNADDSNDGHTEKVRHSGSSSKSKKTKHRKGSSNMPVQMILTLSSLALVVIVVLSAVISNKRRQNFSYNSASSDNTVSTDDSETDSVEDDGVTPKSRDLLTITAEDYLPGIEVPPASVLDSNGNPIVKIIKKDNGEIEKAVYYFNDEKNGALEKEYSAEGTLIRVVQKIDNEKIVYEIVLNEKGAFDGYKADEYDSKDVLVKTSHCSFNGVVTEYDLYSYDEKGMLYKTEEYSSYDNLVFYLTYEYDERGNMTARYQHDQNDVIGIHDEFTYDEMDRVIKEQNYILNVCKTYKDYTYDEEGNQKVRSYLLVDEATMRYESID